ncbi:MAG: addiction module protein [Acidobacteria bacterium]|nr:addiction module protein [Acidobacteriota bacterium]
MNMRVEEIVLQALELPPPARALLVERLIESLDCMPGELTPQWKDEIRRRCRELDQSIVELRSAEDVFAEAYRTLE